MNTFLRNIIFFNFLIFFNFGGFAQIGLLNNSNKQEETQENTIPEDALGRRTPRGTVKGFIEALADANYSKASAYIDFPNQINTKEDKEKVVKVLKHLFDEKGSIYPYQMISNKTAGKTDEDWDNDLEKIGVIHSAEGDIDILLIQKTDESGDPIWQFSEETIELLKSISLDNNALVEKIIPEFLNKFIWGGVPAGQWIMAILLLAASFLISHFLAIGLLYLLKAVWKKSRKEPVSGILHALRLPFKLYLSVVIFVSTSRQIGLSFILRQYFDAIVSVIWISAVLILLYRLTDYLGGFSKKQMQARANPSGLSVILFLERAAKIAIVIIGVIAILGAFGIDVTTGLAALGIGGIALALGAQKTVENFVGSVTLIADRPIRVGDFCKVGDILGTIEKIGIRSTSIRTLDRTLVTIPNGVFSSDVIENYAFRDKFRFITTLNFRYESSPDQMRFLLAEIRRLLYAHPKVFEDPARVRFINFGAHSLDIEIFAYIAAFDYNEFLEIREDIMLRIMDVVEQSGTGFAFPSQTLYFAKDDGIDPEKSKRSEEQVNNWKQNNEMPIPHFTEKQQSDLKDKIKYPPEGSSSAL